jgi:beta-lactamase superfamily II metal-dependent hydrolase
MFIFHRQVNKGIQSDIDSENALLVVQVPAPSQEPGPVEALAVEEKPVEVKIEKTAPQAKTPSLVMKKIDTDEDGIPDTFVIKGEPRAAPTALAKRAVKEKKSAEGKIVFQGQNLRVTFIDVGQGDSCLIQTPGGKNIIIDGGYPGQGRKVISLLKRKGIRRIDCVVATHPDMDHIGGLIAVLDKFEIGEVLDIGHPHTTRTYEDFLKTIEEKNINYRIMRREDALDWGEKVSVQVLNPPKELHGSKNEDSIVLRLVYGKISFLFTGDIGRQAEEDLVNTYHKNLRTTILKCPHHGSRYSSTFRFLEEVRPEVVVISAGRDNPYGHPKEEVLDRYREVGTKIYRTDIDGNIIVTSDGRSYQVRR